MGRGRTQDRQVVVGQAGPIWESWASGRTLLCGQWARRVSLGSMDSSPWAFWTPPALEALGTYAFWYMHHGVLKIPFRCLGHTSVYPCKALLLQCL